MHVVSFPLEPSSPLKVTSAARTKPVPVDQSSLCNIDHFPNFRTQDDLAGAFVAGLGLRLGTNLQVLPLSRAAQKASLRRMILERLSASFPARNSRSLGR
jgi:hypothetical protein